MHGFELLKKGVIWRVFDRQNVNIWRDNWLPWDKGLKISGKKNRSRLKWGSELFIPGKKVWNEEMVLFVFYPHDVDAILNSISFPSETGEDFMASHYEKNGCFSVRSA